MRPYTYLAKKSICMVNKYQILYVVSSKSFIALYFLKPIFLTFFNA